MTKPRNELGRFLFETPRPELGGTPLFKNQVELMRAMEQKENVTPYASRMSRMLSGDEPIPPLIWTKIAAVIRRKLGGKSTSSDRIIEQLYLIDSSPEEENSSTMVSKEILEKLGLSARLIGIAEKTPETKPAIVAFVAARRIFSRLGIQEAVDAIPDTADLMELKAALDGLNR